MKTVVKIKFGSHLYGTNTPSSDTDYKSVHIPDAKDILLQRVKGSVRVGQRAKLEGTKNTSTDIDNESYSLQEFFDLLAHGQTVAIDMLFAPNPEFSTPLWDYIVANKDRFLTNKSAAFVGYCRTQANKYGIKGSRVAAARDAAMAFRDVYEFNGSVCKVKYCTHVMEKLEKEHPEHIRILMKDNGEWYFECCNRQVPFTASVKLAAEIYSKVFEGYGDRARLAESNEGVDWKALSHAVRVGEEALELMGTGRVTFPLPNAQQILDIKLGKIDYNVVAGMIEKLLFMVEQASNHSVLRDEPDYEFIDSLVLGTYASEVDDYYNYSAALRWKEGVVLHEPII